MARTSRKLIKNGNVQIYDRNRPPLPAGSYTVTYSQEITGDVPFSSTVREQHFQIDGPRFSINELDIKSQQPNGKGIYWNITPNITFKNPKLPWLRQLKAPYENTPWMALLVLREDEWNTEEGQPESTAVGTFLERDDILVPSIQGNYDPDELCKYVQLPLGKAKTLLPESDEVEFLCQARLSSDPADTLAKEQEVSLILSKRFPYVDQSYEKGQRFISYLVSLEGQETHLTSTSGDDKKIGLIVLTYWSFISQPESGESFRELMQHLLDGVKEQPQDAWLKYPEGLINQLPVEARPRLQDGYVPLCYHTWSGEETMTWYRGPLIPIKDHIKRPDKPNYTSYEGMIYDPELGLFDNSWSIAWQLGRSIALADESFPALLAHWRKLWGQYFDQVSFYGLQPVPYPELKLLEGLTRDSGWGSNVHKALVYNSDVKVPTVKREAWRKKQRIKREDPIERIRRVMEQLDPDNDGIAAKINLKNTNDVNKAIGWLEQLANLDSLLLPYFVSDERMLPMNAIRFFHIDQEWIEFLLDGAASLGVQNEFDVFINRWMRRSVSKLGRPKFGMLLRSSLVSRWPNLQIEAKRGPTLLKVTGLHLQEQIAAYFFDDVPDCIQIIEPHTVLTYGMETNKTIMLRNISKQHFGEPTGPSISITPQYVDDIGVIKIRELQQYLNTKVQPQPHDPWRPAHFVLQMINGADLGEFKFN